VDEDSTAAPDLRRERWVLAVAAVTVVLVAAAAFVVVRRPSEPPTVSMPVTAYAKANEQKLLVQYDSALGQSVVSATADETGSTVTLHVVMTPFTNGGGSGAKGIAPVGSSVTSVELAAPLGDRTVVDEQGRPVLEVSTDQIYG
jgi:anti-sigma-K factor RskA